MTINQQNPYALDPFQPLRRIRPRRGPVRTLRGGGSIGQPSAIRGGGGGSQLVGAQPVAQQRGAAGPPRGMKQTSVGPTAQEQQANSPLGGLLAAKESYDQVQDAYQGGQNIQKKLAGLADTDSMIALRNKFSDTYIPNSVDMNNAVSPSIGSPGIGGGGATTGLNQPMPYSLPPNSALNSLAGQQSSQILNQVNGLSRGASVAPQGFRAGLPSAPQFTATGTQLPATTAAKAAQVQQGNQAAAATQGSQLQAGSKAAGKGGTSAGSAALSGLGMGLSVADMAENGINFGNATGLVGGGMMGASAGLFGAGTAATVGAMNAWNPIGWALLAGSAAYSIFG